MNFDELMQRLRKSGISISPATVRRWARGEFITAPVRRHRAKGEGRGRISDWPQQSLEEIAGIWVLRSWIKSDKSLLPFGEFHELISNAQTLSKLFLQDPIGWELYKKRRLHDIVYMRHDFDDLSKQLAEYKYEKHLQACVEWIVAIEKVRRGLLLSEPMRCVFTFLYTGSVTDRTLQYNFVGVALNEAGEQGINEVKVVVEAREHFKERVRTERQQRATE